MDGLNGCTDRIIHRSPYSPAVMIGKVVLYGRRHCRTLPFLKR